MGKERGREDRKYHYILRFVPMNYIKSALYMNRHITLG